MQPEHDSHMLCSAQDLAFTATRVQLKESSAPREASHAAQRAMQPVRFWDGVAGGGLSELEGAGCEAGAYLVRMNWRLLRSFCRASAVASVSYMPYRLCALYSRVPS